MRTGRRARTHTQDVATLLYRRDTVLADGAELAGLQLTLGFVRTLVGLVLKALNEREYVCRGCLGGSG